MVQHLLGPLQRSASQHLRLVASVWKTVALDRRCLADWIYRTPHRREVFQRLFAVDLYRRARHIVYGAGVRQGHQRRHVVDRLGRRHQVPAFGVCQDGDSPCGGGLPRPPGCRLAKTQGPDCHGSTHPDSHGLGAAAKRHRLRHCLRLFHPDALPRRLPRHGMGDGSWRGRRPPVHLHLGVVTKSDVHHPRQPARSHTDVLPDYQEERHRQDVGRVRHRFHVRVLRRLRLQPHAADPPTQPYPRHARQAQRHQGCGLQRPPVQNCHRLGWLRRQRLPRRHADQIRLRPRAAYRLHLLHHRRRRRLPGHQCGGAALCGFTCAHHHHG